MTFKLDRVAVDEYVRSYEVPWAMKAGFEYDRAIPLSSQQNQEFMKKKRTMSVLAIGGEYGAGSISVDTMRLVSDNVEGETFKECEHTPLRPHAKAA